MLKQLFPDYRHIPKLYFIFFIFSMFFVNGCGSKQYLQDNRLKNKKGFHQNINIDYHWAHKGDTLYSIAWEYGLNYKQIAKYNQIKSPYLIKLGQKLRLKPKKIHYKAHGKKAKYKNLTKNLSKSYYRNKLNWSWPVKGKIIQYFSPARGKKGIDISTTKRVPVKSTESGKVVYSGHGLTGYGHLIIIKHNEHYLSAYAHNSKLLVEEGNIVDRKQLIAYTGKTASDQIKLHFEIRKNGKPVNPLKYLP